MRNRFLAAVAVAALFIVYFRNSRYNQLTSDQRMDHQQKELFKKQAVLIPLGGKQGKPSNRSFVGEKGGVERVVKSIAWKNAGGSGGDEGASGANGGVQRKRKRAVMIGLKNTLWFYPMRRGGYQDAGFQTDLRRFDNYGLVGS